MAVVGRILVLSFLCFSHSAWSQDCEGETNISLRSELPDGRAGSLMNFEVHDQDGLGTCYANVASTLLQARLGGDQQVSYQQLAILYGMMRNRRSEPNGRVSTRNRLGDVFVEGGFTCETINAAKDNGYVCDRDSVPVERMGTRQASLISSLSHYYEEYSRAIEQEDVNANTFRNHAESFVQEFYHRSRRECRYPQADPEPPVLVQELKSHCLQLHLRIEEIRSALAEPENNVKNYDEAFLEQFQSRLSAIGRVRLETVTLLDKEIETNHCELNSDLQERVENFYYRPMEQAINSGQEVNAQTYLNSFLAQSGLAREDIDSIASGSETQERFQEDLNYASEEHCQNFNAWSNLASSDYLNNFIYDVSNQCLDPDLVQSMSYTFRQLAPLPGGLDGFQVDDILPIIRNIDQDLDLFLMGAIGPECLEQGPGHIPLPENLDCEQVNFPVQMETLRREDGTKDIEETERRIQEQTRDVFRNTVDQNLMSNRPTAVTICTGFFSDPQADSNHTFDCGAGVNDQPLHEVALIGKRCVNGERQYQLQNSWGTGCSYYRNRESRDLNYECDEQGGFIWVPEDVLIRNTGAVSFLQ